MTPNISQTIQSALASIPQPLSVALKNSSIPYAVSLVTKTYSLSTKQSVSLQNYLDMLFLGFIPLSEFKDKLFLELKIPENKLNDILDNLSELLLKDTILDSIKSLDSFLTNNSNANTTSLNDLPNTPPPSGVVTGTAVQPQNETVYTSTQAAILTEKPAEKFVEGTKWSTDD